MSAISLINSGVAWFVAAAVLAFLFSFQKALSGWIAGIGGAVGSLYTAAATYANWPTLRYMLRGNTVSDAPLIIGSLDPCYSCTDRMTVVDVRKKKSKVVPYKELERYSIERKNSPLK
ncbi:TPA: hypothetical protein ACM3WI_000129 [Shigella sonnei]